MKLTKEELFIESLYKLAGRQLKKIYKHKRLNRDVLLQEVANILLTYTIANDLMVMDKKTIDKEYEKMSKLIIDISKGEAASQEQIIEELLSSVVKETYSFYSYNKGLKDVKKIIESNFKGKHFSDRVWANESEVAKYLHSQVDSFLNGKINVNQIRKDIEKTFNTSAYNTKRLVETEVNRSSANAFDRFCKEVGIKRVRYNATLDSRLCNDCGQYNNKVFDFENKIEVPRHPFCRCFYTIEDDSNTHLMNLQLFGINEKKELRKLIDNGTIDEVKYNKCYEYFNEQFKNGISTPMGVVNDKKDRYVHIARRHNNMISKEQIDNIISSLKNPDAIYKTIDKFGIHGEGYIKNIGENELLTIVRSGIITSYYPSENYINKVKRGDLIWERK